MCAAKKEMASPVHVFTASQAGTQSDPCVRPLLSVRRTSPGQLVRKLSIANFALRASTLSEPISGPRTSPRAEAVMPSPDEAAAGSVDSGVAGIGLLALSSVGIGGFDGVAGPPLGIIPLEQADSRNNEMMKIGKARFIAPVNQTESVSSSFQLRSPDFTSRMNVQISCVSTASVIDPPITFPSESLIIEAISASNLTDTRAIG